MKFHPFSYQYEMLDWARGKDRVCFFASPGLGKTVVTLKILDDLLTSGESRGVLIIAPKRVIAVTWPNQIALWQHSKWMRVANLRTKEGVDAWNNGTADVYLINPEMLQKVVPALFKGRKVLPIDSVVIDELSLAKNPTSKRFNAVRPYFDKLRHRIGLTGTPIPNNYLDLYAQIRLIDNGGRLGRSFHHYRQTYFESDYMGFKWTLRPNAKQVIDQKVSDICLVMLGDDYLDVPTCSTEDVEVSLPAEAMVEYKTMEKELLLELKKQDAEIVALSAAALSNKLLQIVGGSVYDEERNVHYLHDAKIKALKKLRKQHDGEPMLVFVKFKHEMKRVLEEIPGAVRFDEKLIPEWRAGKIKTFVCQPQSMSHGIDGLQEGGRIAVWFTLTWSNESYIQANARLVRTGQSNETLIYRLLVPGTIDDAVAAALRDKNDEQSGLFAALKNLQMLKSQ